LVSANVWEPTSKDFSFLGDTDLFNNSTLYAGVQTNIYAASLNKQVLALENIDDDDASDAISDEIEENTVDTTGVGIDIGLLWAFPNAQFGLTFANINEPEFDYGDIGTNCSSIVDPVRQSNCIVALSFANEITLSETAVMNAQTTIDAAVFSEGKHILLSGSADLNSSYDIVGREAQYLNASTSYFPDSYLIPSVRLGISKNLVGSKLTSLGFGFTLFGVVNFDVSGSLDKIEVDGTEIPRQLGFNIGIEEKF